MDGQTDTEQDCSDDGTHGTCSDDGIEIDNDNAYSPEKSVQVALTFLHPACL